MRSALTRTTDKAPVALNFACGHQHKCNVTCTDRAYRTASRNARQRICPKCAGSLSRIIELAAKDEANFAGRCPLMAPKLYGSEKQV